MGILDWLSNQSMPGANLGGNNAAANSQYTTVNQGHTLAQQATNNTLQQAYSNPSYQQQVGVAMHVQNTWDENIPADELTYIGTLERTGSLLQQAMFDPNRGSRRDFRMAFCQRCMFL